MGKMAGMCCAAALAAAVAGMGQSVHATDFTITTIAHGGDLLPGMTEAFNSFGVPAYDGDNVAFLGGPLDQNLTFGIYSGTGGALQTIVQAADTNGNNGTLIPPAETVEFAYLNNASINHGQVAFWGSGSDGSFSGVYSRSAAGTLTAVADITTAAPDGSGNFLTGFSPQVWAHHGQTAFIGYVGSARGIYSGDGGTLHQWAASSEAAFNPPGHQFTSFTNLSMDDTGVAFEAVSKNTGGAGYLYGIYHADSTGAITTVVDTATAAPKVGGGDITFTKVLGPVLADGKIAFWGQYTGGTGIFEEADGALSVIADTTTAIPGGSGTFTSFSSGSIAFDGSHIAFVGYEGSAPGIYTTLGGGSLVEVIGPGQVLPDGYAPDTLSIGPQSLNGQGIAFSTSASSGTNGAGVFLATTPDPAPVPEPATLAIAGWGLLALPRRRGGRVSFPTPQLF